MSSCIITQAAFTASFTNKGGGKPLMIPWGGWKTETDFLCPQIINDYSTVAVTTLMRYGEQTFKTTFLRMSITKTKKNQIIFYTHMTFLAIFCDMLSYIEPSFHLHIPQPLTSYPRMFAGVPLVVLGHLKATLSDVYRITGRHDLTHRRFRLRVYIFTWNERTTSFFFFPCSPKFDRRHMALPQFLCWNRGTTKNVE